ncbi:MAG: glycosyltransferase [Candidatus Magasanikbacteria bacterium]|nr:glycosyltransferase [Candidatus Magasanikbacteria bacterium]
MFDIAVTIVNYKMAEDIRDLLHSMKSDSADSNLKVQIVVVDNTPEEGAWLMFKNNFPEVKYLPQEPLQYSCYRFPDFWIPLYRRSSLGEFKKNRRKVARYLMNDFNHERNQPVDWIMGSAMFARASALEQTGLFDERYFMYFEDCDLCRRFWDANWPIYYIHDIKIKHRHGKGSAKVPGFLSSIMKNPLTRVHITSWLKYMWKWRFKTI